MYELFKTVLILSVMGSLISLILLIIKPFTEKKLPPFYQYFMYLAVLFSMVIPIYKFIPEKNVGNLNFIAIQPPSQPVIQTEIDVKATTQENEQAQKENTKSEEKKESFSIDFIEILPFIWLFGTVIFLGTVFSSYGIYIFKKRKNSVTLKDNEALETVKRALKIKRKIKLRMSEDVQSPLLTGIFFPTIYLPCKEFSKENTKMILLHELTHYKRKDLAVKWFSIFVNAIHWFNPLCYIISKNLSDICEISCDRAVTKNMDIEERKTYMNTILELAAEKGE